ncbi:WhiB family transcriptional regulator [Nocardia goodfellowii]|uniref:4Fe-4S Wbl-type domain-containing protein n=1 Tax=Nocardia goodfellowii TaxID=882446 RepID=A0ABS4QV81_9NOCA|nr:WhiB family transcriptional regulator [Nocardia goodfellowii]MBP2194546.1 hypothetical protein [Nocardia goodfellowii]
MSCTTLPDPAIYPDRGCRRVDQSLFFAHGSVADLVAGAQQWCLDCPRMVACAAWALPLAASGELHTCVVASVRLPRHPDSERGRAALTQLAVISGARPDTKEALAWIAA